MFGGFLRFYSSQGDYYKSHTGSCIDVVDNRPRDKEKQVLKLI